MASALATKEALEASFSDIQTAPVPSLGRLASRTPKLQDTLGGEYVADKDNRDDVWRRWAPFYPRLFQFHDIREGWRLLTDLVPRDGHEGYHLDAGCGDFRIGQAMLGRLPYAKVVGFDRSLEFLREAQKRISQEMQRDIGRIALWRGDLTAELPFPEDQFKAATMNLVFQYLNELEQQQTLNGLARVIEPGGKLYMSTFTKGRTFAKFIPGLFARELFVHRNPGAIIRILPNLGMPIEFGRMLKAGKVNHPSVDRLSEMHLDAGFKRVDVVQTILGGNAVHTIATK